MHVQLLLQPQKVIFHSSYNAYNILSTLSCFNSYIATLDGSTLIAHSNDGDGDVAGNIIKIPAMDWKSGSMRSVSNGQIPQVHHTYAYYTEGYAIMNEF